MATMDNLDTIDVEEPLQKLLNDTSDFDDRKKIRARIRAVKEVKRQEREQERQKRESNRQDEVKRRFQLAQEEKQARMKRFDDMAKEKTIGASSNLVESHIREKHKAADEKKQKVLREFEEKAANDSIGKIGQQSEGAIQTRIKVAQDMKKEKLDSMSKVSTGFHINNNNQKAVSTSTFGGVVYGKAPAKPQGTKGAMAAFKQMDQAANPAGGRPKSFGGGVQRSASSIKEMLLKWIQMMTQEYPIDITNFSTSWNDGMAFCALIHHFCPDAFDYNTLDPKNREYNFTLAFDTAENCADIAPLLDVEDMVRMKKPDWKCVFTYVQSFYRRFRNHESNQHTPIEQ